MTREEIYQDIKNTRGLVPEFFKQELRSALAYMRERQGRKAA